MNHNEDVSSYTEKINKCRCCLKDPGSSDSFDYNNISDEKYDYGLALKHTFDIQIQINNFIGNKICKVCAIQLKNAVDFKKQVLSAEEILSKQYEEFINANTGVQSCKKETSKNNNSLCNNTIINDTFFKQESDDDILDSQSDVGIDLCEKGGTIKEELLEPIKEVIKLKQNTKVTKPKKKISTAVSDQSQMVREFNTQLQETIYNTIQLITNSNMIIFISKQTKFACHYCKKTFLKIPNLREHYKEHPLQEINSHITKSLYKSKGLSLKNVDISNLTCNKCSFKCKDLKELQSHLKIHGLVITGNNLVVPYKLEEGFICLTCNAEFKTFCKLSIHMNTHSNSNICEICGEKYINRRSLRNHFNNIHKEKRCSICLATFPNNTIKKKHMTLTHEKILTRHCLECEKKFKYAYLLKEHMIASHGKERELRKCEFCSKIFPAEYLRTHIRSVHLCERNYPCSICEMRFFTSYDKKRHENIHRNEKLFSCDVCEGRFKTKDSMKRHLLRQHHAKSSI